MADFESGFASGLINPRLVNWSSSDNSIATVKANGILTPNKSGYATITAVFENYTTQYHVYVLNGHIVSLHPSQDEYKVNLTLPSREVTIGAFASLDTGESIVLDNKNLSCKLADETKLIQDSIDSCKFYVKDNISSLGDTEIQIQYKKFITKARVNIIDEDVSSVKIEVDTDNLLPNSPAREVHVTANYNGSDYDVTSLAAISTTDPSIVSVFGNKIYAYKSGSVSIIAKVGNVSADRTVVVHDLDLQIPDHMPRGTTNKVVVKVVTESGLVYDVSDKVTLTTSNNNILNLTNGDIEAKDLGTAVITATLNDGSSASKSITVDPAIVKSIAISNELTTLQVGDSQDLHLVGIYSDGSELSIADELVKWQESPVGVVQFTGNKMTAKQVAVATITATYSGLTASKSFNITPAALTGIAFESSTLKLFSLIPGTYKNTAIKAFYSDGTSQALTVGSTCVSSNISVVQVTSDCSTLTTTGNYGSIVVTASYKGYTAPLTVTMVDGNVTSMTLDMDTTNFYVSQKRSYTVTAKSGTSSAYATNYVQVYSSDPSVLSVDNVNHTITALKTGTATIYTIYDGKTMINKAVQVLADSVGRVTVSVSGVSDVNNLMPHKSYQLLINCTTKLGKNLSGDECGVNLTLINETAKASLLSCIGGCNYYVLQTLQAKSPTEKGTISIKNNITADVTTFSVAPLYNSDSALSGSYSKPFRSFSISDEWGNLQMDRNVIASTYASSMMLRLHEQGRYNPVTVWLETNGTQRWNNYALSYNTNLPVPITYGVWRDPMHIYCNKSFIWKNNNNHFSVNAEGNQSDSAQVVYCDNVTKSWHTDLLIWHGVDAMRVYYEQRG